MLGLAAERQNRPALQIARARSEDRQQRFGRAERNEVGGLFSLSDGQARQHSGTGRAGPLQEIEKLQKEKVGDRELQKVKNQFAADNFRRLQSRFRSCCSCLLADNNRGWRSFNEDPKKIAAVTAEDIQRVAIPYFKPEKRAVALFYTKGGTAALRILFYRPD